MTRALATIAALLILYAALARRLEPANISGVMLFTSAPAGCGAPRPDQATLNGDGAAAAPGKHDFHAEPAAVQPVAWGAGA
jgi:hypothetical protein